MSWKTGQSIIKDISDSLNNNEKWFGVAASASGETHVADRRIGNTSPFVMDGGPGANWGPWLQILGSSDTPVQSGKSKFKITRFLMDVCDSANAGTVQIVTGESADIAAKLAAEDMTEFMVKRVTATGSNSMSEIIGKKIDAGTKVWARWGANAVPASLDGFFGIIEY